MLKDSEAIKYFGLTLEQLSATDWSQLSLGALGKFSDVFSMPESVSQKISNALQVFSANPPKHIGVNLSAEDLNDFSGRDSSVASRYQSLGNLLRSDALSQSEKQDYLISRAIKAEQTVACVRLNHS